MISTLRTALRTGPFHTALREAIQHRELSLDRLHDRLGALGLPVSVSTLSNWQRGASRPHGAGSLRAVAALEEMLGLRPAELTRLLDGPSRRSKGPVPQGMPEQAVRRLRATLDVPSIAQAIVLFTQNDLTVSRDGWRSRLRLVLAAPKAGCDRVFVHSHDRAGRHPEITPLRDCELTQVRTEPESGLVVAELSFVPLSSGDTFAIEYQACGDDDDQAHGWWFPSAGRRYEMTARFEGVDIGRVYRVWRLDSHSPLRDVARLRLINGQIAHFADFDTRAGFHGIRWA